MIDYGFVKRLDISFDEAVEKVKARLGEEGFGILTRIDVHEKFKEKLGINFPRYVILGACNPPSAHKAVSVEENIGLMLPCNVIVYESEGTTRIGVIRPSVAMGMIDNSELRLIAEKIEERLKKVFDSVS